MADETFPTVRYQHHQYNTGRSAEGAQEGGGERRESGEVQTGVKWRTPEEAGLSFELRKEGTEWDPQYLSVITGSSSWDAGREGCWFLEDSSGALRATAHLTLDANRKEHRFSPHCFVCLAKGC